MCPTTYQRPPTSRWLTSGSSSTFYFLLSRFWSTHTWTLSGHSPKFCLSDKDLRNRNDEDREINHHGRPVEVGEDESRPDSTVKVICKTHSYLLPLTTFSRLLTKILLPWMSRFNWRHWRASTTGSLVSTFWHVLKLASELTIWGRRRRSVWTDARGVMRYN